MPLSPAPILLFAALLASSALAEPTALREWTSLAKTKISAVAKSCDGSVVLLTASDGRDIELGIDKLIPADQDFLLQHFGHLSAAAPEGEAQDSRRPFVKEGLAHPIGEVAGPIDANGGGTYFVYLPKTLRKERNAPLLFISTAGGGKANGLKKYTPTAERLGWIVAISVEAKNGYPNFPEENFSYSEACVKHLQEALPIDGDRLFFTGNSGGGATSIRNLIGLDGAGAMPVVGYTPSGQEVQKSALLYGIGGTTDYNRYLTARAASLQGDRGVHRFYAGGHGGSKERDFVDGMFWLEGRFLAEHADDFAKDRLDYEVATIGLINDLKENAPHRAYYWAQFLLGDTYQISGENRVVLEPIATALSADSTNQNYVDGLAALDSLSDDVFAEFGEGGGSKMGHSTAKTESAAKAIQEQFTGTPEIEELAKALQEPTVKAGKKK